jgi:hypothetical protein
MTNRRNFIKKVIAAGVACSLPSKLFSQEEPAQTMIWANLMHLGFNMWSDSISEMYRDPNYQCKTCDEALMWAYGYQPFLNFDETVWNTLLKDMAAVGINMVIIDLGDAVAYESHPEIAVKNAWSPEKLKNELAKMRKLGLEPIPKLNFSTAHDIWLGEYSRMVSTPKYYDVCRDLINEVIDIFDVPRFFHLGMDEELYQHQARQNYVVLRQNDLWWGDLYFFIGQVERRNVRSWIWSDYGWTHPDLLFKKMPKSVLQSNWWYSGTTFDLDKLEEKHQASVQLYYELEKHGYDQVPTGSNHYIPENMEATVENCKKIIDPSRLLGFMQSPWRPTLPPCINEHKDAINQLGRAIKNYYK